MRNELSKTSALLISIFAGAFFCATALADGPKMDNLLKHQLERVVDTEVVVSRVSLPPNTTLPKHWHPGEEFAYLISGTVTLWREGQPEVVVNAGDAIRISLKQVHTVSTGDVGAEAVVFRVHELGQPVRVLAE